MATHSCILAWRIPWTEEPHELYSPWDCKESDMTERLTLSTSFYLFTWLRWILTVARRILFLPCGIWFPDQGSNTEFFHGEHGDHQQSPSTALCLDQFSSVAQ